MITIKKGDRVRIATKKHAIKSKEAGVNDCNLVANIPDSYFEREFVVDVIIDNECYGVETALFVGNNYSDRLWIPEELLELVKVS